MKIHWVAWLLLFGVTYAFENICNDTEVKQCLENLMFFESIAFPFYGHDDESLDDTCEHIEGCFDSLRSYKDTCNGTSHCNDGCQKSIKIIQKFFADSGLKKFSHDLCREGSPMRETYLENVDCLMENADQYAKCHNDSQMSLDYINTIIGPQMVNARCCYSSWFNHCFTNATMDVCGKNATIFVSLAMHQLYGEMLNVFCAKSNIFCDRPPLPPEEESEDLDKDKPYHPTENDIDNEIHPEKKDNQMSSAMVQLSVTGVIILSCFSVLLPTHIL